MIVNNVSDENNNKNKIKRVITNENTRPDTNLCNGNFGYNNLNSVLENLGEDRVVQIIKIPKTKTARIEDNIIKEKLLSFDLNQFCVFIKSKEIKESVQYKYISQRYNDYKISNKKLKELKEEFFIYKVKEKLEDKTQEWDLDQKESVNQYYRELSEHNNKIKEEMDNIKYRNRKSY